MKNISNLTKTNAEKIKMIVLDVDGVIVQRGSMLEQEGTRITYEIKTIGTPEIEMIKNLCNKDIIVNISSGRSLSYLMEMFRKVLPYITITYENGSATWEKGKIIQHTNSFKHLISIREQLSRVSNKLIKGWEPKEFIITIHCNDRVKEIDTILANSEDTHWNWNGEAYDIGHVSQTKGNALKQLIKLYKLEKENIIAIGDNFNDAELIYESGISVSCDYDRLDADYYVPMPAGIMMSKILELKNRKKSKKEENENGDQT